MRKTTEPTVFGRLMNDATTMQYLGCGRKTMMQIVTAAKARRKFGKRALNDREALEKYLQDLSA